MLSVCYAILLRLVVSNHMSVFLQIDFGDAKKEGDDELDDQLPGQQHQQQDDGDGDGDDEDQNDQDFADEIMNSMSSSDSMDRRGTFVGTMNYLSPEMIKDCNANCESDLWALGCIIFKMVTGKVPFPGTAIHQVFPLITEGKIDWPKDMTIEPICRDLIEQLLVLEPADRIGARNSSKDMEALKKHSFFEGIEFGQDLLTGKAIKSLLKETEPVELKQRRVSMVSN